MNESNKPKETFTYKSPLLWSLELTVLEGKYTSR